MWAFFAAERSRVVILAAARVGGIAANATYPAQFLSDNVRIQVNALDAACEYGTERLLFLGSSCVYPKYASQPISEDALLTGALEPTNDAYAIAKITGIMHIQALRHQYGLPYITAMPANLYGPGDTFDLQTSHVLPALIHRFHQARQQQAPSVRLWGTGTPRRDFLHVDDFTRACLILLEHYNAPEPVNVGTGTDVTICELAEMVAAVVGYRGDLEWDSLKPDGTRRKLLDVSRISALSWAPRIDLRTGIETTYAWYCQNVAKT